MNLMASIESSVGVHWYPMAVSDLSSSGHITAASICLGHPTSFAIIEGIKQTYFQ